MHFVKVAAEISRILGHGCAPSAEALNEVDTVEELYNAMIVAADENDEDNSFPCFGPWSYGWEGTLTHTTGSGRMRLEVSNDSLIIELFSSFNYEL